MTRSSRLRDATIVLAIGLGFLASASLGPVRAEPLRDVPDVLKPWAPWVLHGHEQETCPVLPGNAAACAWASRLVLDLDARTGRFSQDWLVQARTLVALPGDAAHWPQDVRDGAQPAMVTLLDDGRPGLGLEPGSHHVTGTFAWDELPESLVIPPETGLVALTLSGRVVPGPQRDVQGQIWLQARAVVEAEEDSLLLAIHRRVTDEVPLRLLTRVVLKVSGKSREMVLGPVLPGGFVPLSIESPLPVRLEPDGRMRVQVRPGAWVIELDARHVGPVEELSPPKVEGTWAPDEVWSFDARPDLRVVSVEGVPSIDPQQTAMPDEWRSLPAFRMQAGDVMKLVEKRRGDADPAPDQVAVQRTLWLDFDGGGITAQDRLGGTLSRSWRLESRPPWQLGRADIAADPQMLTRLAKDGAPGLEIRQGRASVVADSRLEGRARRMPAIGWDVDAASLMATLNLPPGWRLFAAPGADVASGTWISGWTLLDIFLALLITIAALRLWGWPIGLLALATTTLTLTEDGAPRWIWLAALALEGVRRLLKPGRARRVVDVFRVAVIAVLLVVAVMFLLVQARDALHPQLENPASGGTWSDLVGVASLEAGAMRKSDADGEARVAYNIAQTAPQAPMPAPAFGHVDLGTESADNAQFAANTVTAESGTPAAPPERKRRVHDPNEIVQTGPGVPAWTWRQLQLRWNGPVERGQQLRLVLMPPALTSTLGFLRILLIALLIVRTLLPRDFDLRRLIPSRRIAAPAMVAAFAMLCATVSHAQYPPQEMLDELRTRLLERAPCGDFCAQITRLDVDASGQVLRLRAEVSAAARATIALPGGADHWNPSQVLVDGRPADGLLRTDDGVLHALIPEGVHQLQLEGPLPDRDTVSLPLPSLPHRVTARAQGWTISGIHEDGVADDTLQLSRDAHARTTPAGGLAPTVLPPFMTITRRIDLGLTWNVATEVQRVGPATAPVVVRVPLLPGESVTTPDIRVEAGHVLVTLGPGMPGMSWHSRLEETPSILLKAPDAPEWMETWQLDASTSWHVEASGIPPIHASVVQDARMREWRPWPGEEVKLDITRPEAVEGPSLTIDSSYLQITPGLRASDAMLTLYIRSSRGGPHELELPEGAELQSLTVNSLAQPVRQDGRIVTLTVTPGAGQVALTWRERKGLRWHWRSPAVDLKSPSVNATVHVELPTRWVLFLHGPRLGPAVLFWSLLVVMILVAAGLGRWGMAPLGMPSWLLLFIGLSQVPVWMGGIVVAWFLLLVWRRRDVPQRKDEVLNLAQVLVVAWTIATVIVMFVAIHHGLLGAPDMQVVGNGSTASQLTWYADRAAGPLPVVSIVSLPLLAYRFAMLAWALWLAAALLRWLRWAWECFTEGGTWIHIPKKPKPSKGPAPSAKEGAPA